jgi:hypothetical protein
MFTKIPITVVFKGRTFLAGDTINVGKHPGLAEAIEKAVKKSPQDKMVRTGDFKNKDGS